MRYQNPTDKTNAIRQITPLMIPASTRVAEDVAALDALDALDVAVVAPALVEVLEGESLVLFPVTLRTLVSFSAI